MHAFLTHINTSKIKLMKLIHELNVHKIKRKFKDNVTQNLSF